MSRLYVLAKHCGFTSYSEILVVSSDRELVQKQFDKEYDEWFAYIEQNFSADNEEDIQRHSDDEFHVAYEVAEDDNGITYMIHEV